MSEQQQTAEQWTTRISMQIQAVLQDEPLSTLTLARIENVIEDAIARALEAEREAAVEQQIHTDALIALQTQPEYEAAYDINLDMAQRACQLIANRIYAQLQQRDGGKVSNG